MYKVEKFTRSKVNVNGVMSLLQAGGWGFFQGYSEPTETGFVVFPTTLSLLLNLFRLTISCYNESPCLPHPQLHIFICLSFKHIL